MLKVKEVADLVGVSVRTLHYYDRIGLLEAKKDNQSGYRLYDEDDLERLQQILFFKELDFNLKEIKNIMYKPDYNKFDALTMQHKMLLLKKKRLESIIKSLEKTIELEEIGGREMKRKDDFQVFNYDEIEKFKDQYRDEVEERYSKEAVAESYKKTGKYSKEDWKRVLGEGNKIFESIAALMPCDPGDEKVQSLLEDYRSYISRSYYDCTPEIFEGLGQMYVMDERFTKNIDKVKEGLAQYISDGIKIYSERLKSK